MIVYVDSSVVLRRLLRQPGSLREWRLVRTAVGSRLVEVECLRTLDRLRLAGAFDDRRAADLRNAVLRVVASLEVVEVTRGVLARAAQPAGTALGTLDAIHLASALLWRHRTDANLAFATHDETLAVAARAYGLRVLGV